MTATPYARREHSVPVTVVTQPEALLRYGGRATAVVRFEPLPHNHASGTDCIACEARSNVRVLLFELQEKSRLGLVEPFTHVVVDATSVADARAVADALIPGRLPAFGLRDHAVARNFHLQDVI